MAWPRPVRKNVKAKSGKDMMGRERRVCDASCRAAPRVRRDGRERCVVRNGEVRAHRNQPRKVVR